jgi:hypothetical protein
VGFSHQRGFVGKGDRIANSCSICHGTLKWWRHCSSTCLTWPFWTATFYFPHVRERKFRVEIFDSFMWGICWHKLVMNGLYQGD